MSRAVDATGRPRELTSLRSELRKEKGLAVGSTSPFLDTLRPDDAEKRGGKGVRVEAPPGPFDRGASRGKGDTGGALSSSRWGSSSRLQRKGGRLAEEGRAGSALGFCLSDIFPLYSPCFWFFLFLLIWRPWEEECGAGMGFGHVLE